MERHDAVEPSAARNEDAVGLTRLHIRRAELESAGAHQPLPGLLPRERSRAPGDPECPVSPPVTLEVVAQARELGLPAFGDAFDLVVPRGASTEAGMHQPQPRLTA